jgi:predicted O-linked N-acetylglucosamine transferase (SPINDLY family)
LDAGPSFDARFAAALGAADRGRVDEALRGLAALAAEVPRHASARLALATLLHRLGRRAQACTELDEARRVLPQDAALANLHAEVLLSLGRSDQAIAAAEAALAIDPAHALARFHLGIALLACARHREAAAVLGALIEAEPDWAAARQAAVRARLLGGDPPGALAAASHPCVFDSRPLLVAIAADFLAAGAVAEHAALLETLNAQRPRDVDTLLALAADLHRFARPSAALACCERALTLRPGDPLACSIRAAALIDRGDVESGLKALRDVLPAGDAALQARHLVLMHYDPEQTCENLFATHRDYAHRHLHAFAPPYLRRAADADKVLRIGWLSPRFGAGPVSTFLGGLLAQFDRSRHRHLLIDLTREQGDEAQALHALADDYIDAGGLDDRRLLQRLRDLDLDVLVDLAGHATWNRIGVVAQRVAPLQVCWLDWFDTTAIAAMDAWISDRWLTPQTSAQRYSERVVHLPSGRFCYTPPADAPGPEREGGGAVRFASFNRLAKLNDGVVDAWAEILQRIPDAQLHLRTRHLGEEATRERVLARFAARGIAPDRLQLGGDLPYRTLLEAYRQVDIALDPFPFSGCTTTCDALWMGCAVIALPGETFVSRQSAGLLWRLGREEWVARDRTDYVERACAAAAQVDGLRSNRAALRESVRTHLADAGRQAGEFAALLRELWRERCAGG